MKRTLSLLLSILMILSVFGITAGAAKEKEKEKTFEDFNYLVADKNSVTVTKYTGKNPEVNIPGKIDGKTVTVIGNSAFRSNKKLKKVTIPEGVKKIDEYAFSDCSNLESVSLPKNLSKLGVGAFTSCLALKEISIPNKITEIADSLFANCKSLKKVTLPNSVTQLGYGVFSECSSLEKIKLPSKLSSIGNSAFSSCSALKSILLPDSVTKIEPFAFTFCCALKSIILSNNLKTIEIGAFTECTSLKSIHIPKSVTTIGSYAFDGCSKLESVSGGKGLKKIYSSIFRDAAFARNSKNWENSALYFKTYLVDINKNVKGNYKVKEGTTIIATDIFNGCKRLTGVYLPKSVTSISISERNYPNYCFYSPKLKKITVANDNNYLKSVDGVLYSKNMKILYRYPAAKSGKSFSVPKSVKTIWEGAFSGCENLFKVSFHPNSTAIIKGAAFNCCKNLSDITITNGVTLSSDAGFGWYYENDDDQLVKGLKFKGNSSNKSLMSYLNIYGFNDCFVPICKDGSEKHTLKTAKAKAPTYFTKGYKAFKYCTVCKEKFNVKFIDKITIPDTVISAAGGKGQISIKYNAIKGANGFQVMHVNQSTARYDTKTFSTNKSKTVKITGLDPAEYTIAVRVFQNKNGKTYWSNWIWINGDYNAITVK